MSSLLAPAIRKTAAMSPAMIHRAMFIINSFIEEYLHPTRQDGGPGCDTSEHPGTRKRARGWQCWGPVPTIASERIGRERFPLKAARLLSVSFAAKPPEIFCHSCDRHVSRTLQVSLLRATRDAARVARNGSFPPQPLPLCATERVRDDKRTCE